MKRNLLISSHVPLVLFLSFTLSDQVHAAPQNPPTRELVRQTGGQLHVALRSEPKTLNPILSVDATSREVIGAMHADLVHINRETQRTEPALAESWKISPDGRTYTLQLRQGVRFSDGVPFTADDVVFSFQLYLDERMHSPQRDLLIIDDKPLTITKIDSHTVEFGLAHPYGPGERLFDGLAILPQHLLEKPYREGKLSEVWGTNAAPQEIAGLGAFRLKNYSPGQSIMLERNPYYWKKDRVEHDLPYLNGITFAFVPNEDAQVVRFRAGESHVLERVNADNFNSLRQDASGKAWCMKDLGPGLEFLFLLLNMNHSGVDKVPGLQFKQVWFNDLRFRQALSLAVDRKAMVKLVYQGLAAPVWGNVTPGNKLWLNRALSHPQQSLDQARALLQAAGFSWDGNGQLLDRMKNPVGFTILVSSSNAQRSKVAAVVQDDLKKLGINIQVVPMEFRTLVDRVLNTKDYEAVLMNLVNGDVDPTPEMNLWLSDGPTHLWNLGESKPATNWEEELDRLMGLQMATADYAERKKLYDRVQEIVSENLPFIFLLSPNILVGAQSAVGNFHPAILEPYTLWNADELYLQRPGTPCR